MAIEKSNGIVQTTKHFIMLLMKVSVVSCAAHTLAYSLIGLQELNLVYKYPSIFWDCACLIVDSGGLIDEDEEDLKEKLNEEEEEEEDRDWSEIDSPYEEEETINITKAKVKTTDYGKISTAIGTIQSRGVDVQGPHINLSNYTFTPDVEKEAILYGIRGILKVGKKLVDEIIANRPYNSFEDFLSKVKTNKTQCINLIKSGAFDCFGDRFELMKSYIEKISDQKKALNLRNVQMLISKKLFPDSLDFERRIFNFNKYLKSFKEDLFYNLDDRAITFLTANFSSDILTFSEDGQAKIGIKEWDKIYKKKMDVVRAFIKANHNSLLEELNETLLKEVWNKYCQGSISKWEMDSISFYYHEHELSNMNEEEYEIENFFELPEEPEIDHMIYIKGKEIPIYKLSRIAGTVLNKDKIKNTLTVLTLYGVVTVKIFRPQFVEYDKQISMRLPNGKKKIVEKSWFSRGNKVIVTGIKRGDTFIPKKYKNSTYKHIVELISSIDDFGNITTITERSQV